MVRNATIFAIVSCLSIGFVAHAEESNPQTLYVYVPFKYNGQYHAVTREFPAGRYEPGLLPWGPPGSPANWRTTTRGTKIQNAVTPDSGLPFQVNVNGTLVSVTQAMVDEGWDNLLPGATRLSSATFQCNCYAYATGKTFWMGPSGFNAIVDDEAGWSAVLPAKCYANTAVKLPTAADHAFKIISCCVNMPYAADQIAEAREKIGCSGVYKSVYLCPGGMGFPSGSYYRKQ